MKYFSPVAKDVALCSLIMVCSFQLDVVASETPNVDYLHSVVSCEEKYISKECERDKSIVPYSAVRMCTESETKCLVHSRATYILHYIVCSYL